MREREKERANFIIGAATTTAQNSEHYLFTIHSSSLNLSDAIFISILIICYWIEISFGDQKKKRPDNKKMFSKFKIIPK